MSSRRGMLSAMTGDDDDRDRDEDDVDDDLDDDEHDDDGAHAAVRARREDLCHRFATSAEAEPLTESQRGWAELLLVYAYDYDKVEAQALTPDEIRFVVFDLFPRKVSCEPDAADDIVVGLRGFLGFLGHAIGLDDAAGCQAVLDGDAAARLRARLADPRTWGLAKGFVMSGRAAGFDMTSEADFADWALIQNAAMRAEETSTLRRPSNVAARRAQRVRKDKRRRQKASRKKNR